MQTIQKNKSGRNDPCFYGGGNKFKKCCLYKSHPIGSIFGGVKAKTQLLVNKYKSPVGTLIGT